MPSRPLLALAFLLFIGGSAAAQSTAPRHLAFWRDDDVWVAALDGTGAKKIARGQMPEISPDGTRVAFNTVQATGRPAHRQIAIFDLASGTTRILEGVPSDNVMAVRWSPDGARLLCDYYVNDERQMGVINADGSGFRAVLASQTVHHNYWAAAWAADGQSIFAEDMEFLYRLDLQGNVLKKWLIEQIVPRGGMSGDVRLNASPDGTSLLMDIEMDEKERAGWDGPPPAIWVFDLTTEASRRLTAPDLYAWDSAWLDAPDSILFVSQGPRENTPSIYRMSASGQGADRKLLVRNARGPGASR